MRFMIVTLPLVLFLSCGDDDAPVPPSYPPTWTAAERMAVATSIPLTRESIAPTREPFYASEDCKAARERLAGSDFVIVDAQERGWPSWEERFLDVDLVVRAKLLSSHPRVVMIKNGNDSERFYPAIEMNFRVFEAFRGSASLDYIVAWQVGWDYYGSGHDAACVRLDDVADLRQPDYTLFDDREAILFLDRPRNVKGLENISSKIENYILARLPSEMRSPNLLEDELWRWLPHHEGDSFYDKKYLIDSPESQAKGAITTQELREVGNKIEELRYTHDLDCVYEAYRRSRNFDEKIEESMKSCARER